jgi:hypothetical protein
LAEEVLSEPAAISEPEEPAPVEPPSSFESDLIADQSDFPTLVGGPMMPPPLEEVESEAMVELGAVEIPDEEASDFEAAQTIAEEPAPVVEDEVDEAAITQVEAFVPLPMPAVPQPEPEQEPEPVSATSAAPEPAPRDFALPTPRPETSRMVAAEEPVSSPSRTKSKPWLPIAAVVGVIVIAGIWIAVSRRDQQPGMIVKVPATPAAQPTPVPIVTEIETKLQRARGHVANEEFDEAIALLKAVQGIDPNNADASALLTQIDEAKRVKADKALMAERERKVGDYMQQAKAARERRDWPAMRVALREARKLDFQNALMRSELENLDSEAAQGEKEAAAAEMERKRLAEEAEDKRLKDLAATREKENEATKKREAEREAAEREAESKRIAMQESQQQKKRSTPRPIRRPADDNDDQPVRRQPVASRGDDDRPPAPTQTRTPARSTPVPARIGPRKGVVGTGAPGG